MENLESPVDYKQVYHRLSAPVHVQSHSEPRGNKNHVKTGTSGPEGGNPIVERPKVNLKPRKEQLEGEAESKRNTSFGSACPRESSEREIDIVAVKADDLVQPQYRRRHDTAKTERVFAPAAPARFNNRPENVHVDHRMGKNSDRRDHQLDVVRTYAQRRNWQSENWKNKKEFDKHQQRQHHQQQERPHSPETWQKPVEHPRPASSETFGPRYGKAASAVELAQAFSKSVSDSATTAEEFQAGVKRRSHG